MKFRHTLLRVAFDNYAKLVQKGLSLFSTLFNSTPAD